MTNPEITQRQADIDARVAAATPGEWQYDAYGTLVHAVDPYGHGPMRVVDIRGWGHLTGIGTLNLPTDEATVRQDANGELIANAMPDLIWQRERIKSLESELAQYKRDTMVRSNYEEIYQATKRWQEKVERQELQIKALEAERADTEAARIKNWECFAAESKCTRKARKWARRWKSLARKRFGHENYYKGRLLHYKEQLERRDNRIAALENAAKSCATCLYHTSGLEPVPEYCKQNCGKPDIRHAGWVFDEKRWVKKEAAVNDKS